MITFDAHLQLERKLNDVWERENPILLNGELIAAEMNDGNIKFKVGDGTTRYRSLPFANISNTVVPTKVSELENDKNYLSVDGRTNSLSLPDNCTISSSDCLNIQTNMFMGITADILQLRDYGDGATLTFQHGAPARLTGDLLVPEPATDESVVNKAYVDNLIQQLRDIIPNR